MHLTRLLSMRSADAWRPSERADLAALATRKRLHEDWNANFAGPRLGKVAVLGEGLTWSSLSQFSAEELQIVNARNFSVADVSRIYGVPPYMLADPSRATYASARESSRHFAMLSLAPWVAKLERAFSASVLGAEFALTFDMNSLTRADPEARWASWERARRAGVLSPNWPVVPGGDDIAPPNTSAAAAGDKDDADEPPPVKGFRVLA